MDPVRTSRHFRKEHAGPFKPVASAGVVANSTTNATDVERSIPQHAALLTVKNAIVHNHPPRFLHSLPQPTTPVRSDRLENLLHGYSLPLKTYLAHSFEFGFRVHFQGERRVFEPPNLKSAIAWPDIYCTR